MSGCIIRADGWQTGQEEHFLAVNPSGEIVSLYQTDKNAVDEEHSIFKKRERPGFDKIQCLQYSRKHTGLAAVGQLTGSCTIFNILQSRGHIGYDQTDEIEPDSLDNSHSFTLKPHQARSCNSVSFNEEGLIAMGYDRGRQDHSIQVWNINTNKGTPTKVYSFVPNESISSVCFCPDQPNNLLAGSYKLLREFDFRIKRPVYSLATRCTQSISADPANSYVFASCSEDGSLSIWDRRKLTADSSADSSSKSSAKVGTQSKFASAASVVLNESPLLSFRKLLGDSQRRTGGAPFKLSSVVRGEISALFGGDMIRRWKIGTVPNLDEPGLGDSLFISRVSDVRTRYERVISYDYLPSTEWAHAIEFVCMRQSGSVYRMSVEESQTAARFSSNNALAFTGPEGEYCVGDDMTINSDIVGDDISSAGNNKIDGVRPDIDYRENADKRESSTSSRSLISASTMSSAPASIFAPGRDISLRPEALLENDICSIMKKRASLNYGMDPEVNMHILDTITILETQSQLRNTWKWIQISETLISAGKMSFGGYDLGFLGISGVWETGNQYDGKSRYFGPSKPENKRSQSAVDLNAIHDNYNDIIEKSDHLSPVIRAVKAIVTRRSREIHSLAVPVIGFKGKSAKELQRRLAMYVIGWDFSAQELEKKYESLVKKGNFERAAGWALFHGNISKAVKILQSSNRESFRVISTAISAYDAFKNVQTNSAWKDQCRQLAAELENPYLRVIFAYVADRNWWDVLDESALPLRERLGVALRFLKDEELDLYLERLIDDVIKRGEIEGLIVTGLTKQGIDLLQSFVDRTGDVQSACLIASFACPKYFKDIRVESWIVSYKRILNSWRMFSKRARFEVARRKLSVSIDGQQHAHTLERQIYIQCANCHKSIGNEFNNIKSSQLPKIGGSSKKAQRLNLHCCPHCGYPLPRCAICLMTQGVPVPKELINIDMLNVEKINKKREFRKKQDHDNRSTSHDSVDEKHDTKEKQYVEDARKILAETHFKECFSFCLSCNHCMHAGHAEEWFSKHYVCPVPDCNCHCNNK